MAKEKACTKCKTIYSEGKCPNCGETVGIDSFKGEAIVFNADKSIIAHNLLIKSNGRFAVKIK
jgi:RNA polymerase subunit RPABC4/transcription elongation factor Spt4